jgi:NAD(P)-dependent dehydrogenase (short-subunit alcohol dehydrogenase family)
MQRVALVTGASRGIGAAAARTFARAGYAVALSARTEAALEHVATAIRGEGGEALAIVADVGNPQLVELMIQRTVERFGRLDAAFNNAGGNEHPPAPLASLDPQYFATTLRANLVGTYLCMRAEIIAMLAHEGGAIVNMSSTAGMQGLAGLAPYSAAKHGIIGLSKTAALDYAASQIRVNVIAPGPIATERIDETQRKRVGEFVPLKRMGSTDDVARLVLWLCSDESSFITGTVVSIDGGRLAGTPSFATS